MTKQHKKSKGYDNLSQTETNETVHAEVSSIDFDQNLYALNAVKLKAIEVGDLMQELHDAGSEFDQRWLSIAKTDLQTGFMAAVRAIAKPTTF
jgi:hypothetical protein